MENNRDHHSQRDSIFIAFRFALATLTLTELLIAYAISASVFVLDLLHAKTTGKSVTGRKLMVVEAKFSNSTPKRHIFIYKLYIVVLITTLLVIAASTAFLLLT